MAAVDLLIVVLILAVAAWGYYRGLSTNALVLIGFAGGALLGSRVAPLVLEDGLRDEFAPALALPGALIFGAALAALLERVGFRFGRRLRRAGLADAIAGAVLAGCLGLVFVWISGGAAARVDRLEDPVKDSEIIDRLNAVLPPPGPLLEPDDEPEELPELAGPAPGVRPADPDIVRDPQVRAATRSVVQIYSQDSGGTGAGWIAGKGIVVTAAHLVLAEDKPTVQVRGKGRLHAATAIWFDCTSDIAVLRAPGLRHVRALKLDVDARKGTSAALIGFPEGRFEVVPGRLGRTASRVLPGPRGRPVRRRLTSFLGLARSGNSGGPMVDERGRVVTTVFAKRLRGLSGFGTPSTTVRAALRKAGPPVDTRSCRAGGPPTS